MRRQIEAAEGSVLKRADAVFRGNEISPAVVRELISQLHQTEQYDLGVECLMAAIRHDQGQAWMYAVLPLQMKLAERPQAEIDRALLARVDFSAGNSEQTLIAASLLSRMMSWDSAMDLCRESLRHDPWQTSVWLKASSIADRSGNPDHIVWARTGILKHVWTDDARIRHQESQKILDRTLADVRRKGPAELTRRLQQQVADAMIWDLIVKAEWAGNSDVDLAISEPGGTVCDHSHQITRTGGILVRTGGGGRRRHIEEYRCHTAPQGIFKVSVRLIRGRVVSGRVRLTVIRYQGTGYESKETINVPVGEEDAAVEVEVSRGRRIAAD